jgi:hypothetical protein
MKNIYLLISLLIISFTTTAQTFRIYTAVSNGNWSNAATWSSVVRTDNVKKNRYFIPAGRTVVATTNFDYTDLGDVDVVVGGTLRLSSNVIFALTAASNIDIFPDGEIESIGASAIFISNSLKYFSFGSRSLSGPAYTDLSIPGFANFTTLTAGLLQFTGTSVDQVVSLKWAAAANSKHKLYDVEFSSNGSDWLRIGTVYASAAANAVSHYDFSYRYGGSTGYFRLKQTGIDGSYSYSATVAVTNSHPDLQVFAAYKRINIRIGESTVNTASVKVLDLSGFVLKSREFKSVRMISIDAQDLKPGTYIVHITDENKNTTVKRLMIL